MTTTENKRNMFNEAERMIMDIFEDLAHKSVLLQTPDVENLP